MPPKKTITFGKISNNTIGKETVSSSEGGFGTFSKIVAEETNDVEELMGFKGFGNGKSKKVVDIESLVEQSKQFARSLVVKNDDSESEARTE